MAQLSQAKGLQDVSPGQVSGSERRPGSCQWKMEALKVRKKKHANDEGHAIILKMKNFQDELRKFLKQHDVEYDDRYLWG